jgi:hypothetical protein
MLTNLRKPLIEAVPELPGGFDSANSLQRFNVNRKYCIGFQFTVQVKDQTFQNIQFPGTARMFLGFTMFDTSRDPANSFSLNLNNEDIVTSSSWAEFTKVNQFPANTLVSGTSYKEEYYPYPRALSGNDKVKIQYTGKTGGTLFVNFYFKDVLTIIDNSRGK